MKLPARFVVALVFGLGGFTSLPAQDAGDASDGHIPPPAPEHPMPAMSDSRMVDAMQMDDSATFAMLKVDRLERAESDNGIATDWKLSAWAGGDFDKAMLRSEGEYTKGDFGHADVELLWDRAVASFWDTQVGVRHDFGRGADRNWAAFGVQGLAPYWFGVEATAYVGDAGQTALRVEVDYDLSLSQRLILQPRIEINAYGKEDRAAGVGSGLSDGAIGLRLRYEIRREVAPYVGVEWSRRFGESADFARAEDFEASGARAVLGLRIWF